MSALPWFFAYDHLPLNAEGMARSLGDGAVSASSTGHGDRVVSDGDLGGRHVRQMEGAGSGWLERSFTPVDHLTFGVRYKHSSSNSGTLRAFCNIYNSSAENMLHIANSAGDLQVRRGTTVLATASQTLTPSAWVFIEFSVYFHGTDGRFELRYDGVVVASGTDVDTLNNSGPAAKISLKSTSGSSAVYCWWSDTYIQERPSLGDPAFYGPIVLHPLYPASDHSVEWTPDSGLNNYDRVNNNSDASYIESDTLGETDEYTLDNLPAGANSIIALVPVTVGFAPDGGAPAVNLSVRDADGVIAEGPDRVLGVTGLQTQAGRLLTRDAGGLWTSAQVNGSRLLIKSV